MKVWYSKKDKGYIAKLGRWSAFGKNREKALEELITALGGVIEVIEEDRLSVATLSKNLQEITMFALKEEIITMSRAKELLGVSMSEIRTMLKEEILNDRNRVRGE